MRHYLSRTLLLLATLVLAALPLAAADKANVVILSLGGTNTDSAATQTRVGPASGQAGAEALLKVLAQLKELANVSGEQVANVGGQHSSDALWPELAQRVKAVLGKPDVDAVVITDNTDTLDETAYFLNLVVSNDKAIVLTAAMDTSTTPSANGPPNLFNAVAVAADPQAANRGVLVVLNGNIQGAQAFNTTSTADVQTFQSVEAGRVGTTLDGRNRWLGAAEHNTASHSEFALQGADLLPQVEVIDINADASPNLIDAAVKSGARGIVAAGVDSGNLTGPALEAVKAAVTAGVVVVRATPVPNGTVTHNVGVNDDAIGTVASGDLSPAHSRVLLTLALLNTADPAKIQEYFDSY